MSGRGLTTVFMNAYVIAGLGMYGLGAAIWLTVLSQWDVSKAYHWLALGFVMTMIVGKFVGEQLSLAPPSSALGCG